MRFGYATVELVEAISGSPPDSFQFRFFDVSVRPRLSGEAVVALEQRGELLHLLWGLDVVEGRVFFGQEQQDYYEFRERL